MEISEANTNVELKLKLKTTKPKRQLGQLIMPGISTLDSRPDDEDDDNDGT